MAFVAFLDACVLIPFTCRDLLLELAYRRMYRAVWSADVLSEVRRHLQSPRFAMTEEDVDRLFTAMRKAILDPEVTGYQDLISGLSLPDPEDRHVLAAAIRAGADVIVTSNLKDFPRKALLEFKLEAQHPDEFLVNLYDLYASQVLEASRALQRRKKKPPRSWAEYLEIMSRVGLPRLAAALHEEAEVVESPRMLGLFVEPKSPPEPS